MAHPLTPARVAGRRLDGSLAAFEHACGMLLAEEQEKLDANSALIAVLSDAIRLAREYTDAVAITPRT